MEYSQKQIDALYSKIEDSSDSEACWIFTGYIRPDGYGDIKLSGTRKNIRPHRLSKAIADGIPLPKSDVFACHKCDNPRCVNPNHIFWGSHADNMGDMANKGRATGNKMNNKGRSNPRSKLSKRQFEEIKARIQNGEANTHIAKDYPVTHSTVSMIKLGKIKS